MSSQPSSPIDRVHPPSQPKLIGLSGLRSFVAFFTPIIFCVTLFYVIAPKLLRKYSSNLRVGQLGFLSLKGLEWSIPRAPFKNRGLSTKAKLADREQASKSDQALRVTINSIGLRPGSSEGSRRQWIALRLDGVHIWVPKGHLRSPQPSDSLSDDSDFEASSSEASYRPSRARKISAASSTSQRSHFSHSDPKPT